MSCLRGLVLGVALAASVVGCFLPRPSSPRLTGTCDGACARYVQCKSTHSDADRTRCLAECPQVFSDRDSLLAFESLSCEDVVEFVDGSAAKTAAKP